METRYTLVWRHEYTVVWYGNLGMGNDQDHPIGNSREKLEAIT